MIRKKAVIVTAVLMLMTTVVMNTAFVLASEKRAGAAAGEADAPEGEAAPGQGGEVKNGGGYAASGQLEGVGYTAKIYDATNGLPTSDANWILGSSDGYIWIGGYSGIIRFDGRTFERMDASGGLTSGRVMFEDRRGRIWVGTNDNGAVMMDGINSVHYTYKEGLRSSSIRAFAEDDNDNIYIGSTSGISFVDGSGNLNQLLDERLNDETIWRLVSSSDGRIYGNTSSGAVFCIENSTVTEFYTHEDLKIPMIYTIFADPDNPGMVYYGTEGSEIFHGKFGDSKDKLESILADPLANIEWITSASGRIWACSQELSGYLDDKKRFHVLNNLPMNNAIYMLTEDYQGNLWYASSRQGVMEVVTNNFLNVTEEAGVKPEVVNSTCMRDGLLYVGTDSGLHILDGSRTQSNELTKMLQNTRIRCITKDNDENLWISTFTNNLGLICYGRDGKITSYTEENGMTSNLARCTVTASDGSVIAGTNDGINIIRNGVIERSIEHSDIISNTVFLTVEEGEDGEIYAGTDGDGIYCIGKDRVRKLGREDGLTSDVILRIKKDTKRDVYWIITSNSIEYMKDGRIVNVDTFPYNNNFDIYYGDDDNLWILSSYGVYTIKAREMLDNNAVDYRLYTIANGLTGAATANSFSELADDGNLYISCRNGVSRVNINHYFDQSARIITGVRSVNCSNAGEILPDGDGVYTIPSEAGRIQITPAILDYTMTNPLIHMYLEGSNDDGITAEQSDLKPLEYTGLSYGEYVLHISVLDESTGDVYQDQTFRIVKEPQLQELLAVRILLIALIAALVGIIVWRVMTGTVIRRQYEEVRKAKEEAERANSAKSRFLANMSHEIRTPINTIMGMDEMILREDAEGVPKSYFMSVINYALDIRNASESLLGLINDLLDISKIESGKMHLVEQEYDSAELLRSLVSMIRVRSIEKDLSFDVKIDEKLPVRLYGDCGKIKQVVLNLLTNAVKYTAAGGLTLTVSVTGTKDNSCDLRFSVKDTGIGVKEEDMEKLFTAYERLDEEKNSAIQGTGLGLDISRRFSELMGGNLWCESVYGEGSEFILTLSQKIVDEKCIGVFNEHVNERAKGPYVPQFIAPDADVLVVDDNPMNLNVIKGLLKATRVFVTTAMSGEECLEKLKYGKFNVVLLDHMMPGMDGVETVGKIREKYPDLPVYALTANSMAGGEEFYKSKGFDGYLTKPVDSVVLEKAIMKHLPEEIMMKPVAADVPEEPDELPEDLLWLTETEGINVPDGIKNSGGVSSYIFSLKLFLDTMEDNAGVIEKAYEEGDIRLYTVKVHALKSSARIIGANDLSSLAEKLEEAGNKKDMGFIKANTDRFLDDYRSYKEKLGRMNAGSGDDDRPEIDPEELKGAYEALRECVPQMDYDAVEMILSQLKEYRLPPEDGEKAAALEKMLKVLDWDGMEKLLT